MIQSKHCSRRHSRGAVLVEAAVVIPCFVILFGGMLFLHHVLREQQRVSSQAKNEAWTYAMASCTGDGNGLPQPPYSSTMPGAPGSDITLQDSLGRAKASATGTASVSEAGTFAFSQSVSAHDIVFCNNQTAAGDLSGVAKWLLANVKGLLGW